MSGRGHARRGGGACDECRRRAWLLADLGPVLDFRSADRERLWELLALPDEELIAALGGRRRADLRERYRRWSDTRAATEPGPGDSICRHDERWPAALRSPSAPSMLTVQCGVPRLLALAARPSVAVLGASRASDYGLEMGASLAHGLAVAGVTVLASLDTPIGRAAHAAALEVRAGSVAVLGGGLDVEVAVAARQLRRRLPAAGCVVSELPADCGERRWGARAAERAIAWLADAWLVVEGEDTRAGLAAARFAAALGRPLAAVPGALTSSLAAGPLTLLAEGARLVRGAEDVLDVLHLEVSAHAPTSGGEAAPPPALEPRLDRVLEAVGAGCDTPAGLARQDRSLGAVLAALGELEALGMLRRTGSGRYVRREPVRPGIAER